VAAAGEGVSFDGEAAAAGDGVTAGSAVASGGGSWNQLCRHLAQRTVRPSGPTALSGTTYRVVQAGQAMIIPEES